jgi:integrase
MAEWLKAHAWKACLGETLTWVRIPLSPPARKKPPTYTKDELDRIFRACNEREKTIFATLLLTGLREQELYFLSWPDVNLNSGTIKVTPKPNEGFSPNDYEEHIIPIPPDLVKRLKTLSRKTEWVFPNAKGRRTSHLLRTLKTIAMKAKVENATPTNSDIPTSPGCLSREATSSGMEFRKREAVADILQSAFRQPRWL